MTKIEALELELNARKMVDGTKLDWVEVLRHRLIAVTPHVLDYFEAADFELALGIVEGKPVWSGDDAYWTDMRDRVTKLSVSSGCDLTISGWSWYLSAPKTVMIELSVEDVGYWDAMGRTFSVGVCTKQDKYACKSRVFYEACRKALEGLK